MAIIFYLSQVRYSGHEIKKLCEGHMKLNFLSLVEGRQFDRLIQARGDLLELLGDAVSMKLILA